MHILQNVYIHMYVCMHIQIYIKIYVHTFVALFYHANKFRNMIWIWICHNLPIIGLAGQEQLTIFLQSWL